MKKFSLLMFMMLLTATYCFSALPSKVFAPYVDVMLWPTPNINTYYSATGQKYYTLAFIITGSDNKPAWGGALSMSTNHMLDQITQLRASGGDVIVSFGGANGTPIDATYTNISDLVNAYQSIINQYGLTWIDFDIEGWWVQDQASIDRRNQAAAILQSQNPGLRITYCLPALPSGLTSEGVSIINKAKAAGVNIYGVNVMAMDYGAGPAPNGNGGMGGYAIDAAQNARSQTGLNVGITPMIGQNDVQGEIFSLSDAQQVLNFATSTSWVNMLAMWSMNRDNGGCPGQTSASPTCSGLSQNNYAFTNIFKSYSGTTNNNTPPTVSITSPSNGATYNAPASITINANASDANGSVTKVDFYNGGTFLGSDASSPFSFTWSNVSAGTYSLTAKATDNGGASTTSSVISVTVNGNSGASIPGTIQAENYSAMSGIQLEGTTDTGGGQNVGWIDAGDWMDYSVNVASSGAYTVQYRVASLNGGGSIQLRLGSSTLATTSVPNTGGWQNWTTVSASANLNAGTQTLRLYASTGGFNVNWIQFSTTSTNNPPTVSITSPANNTSYTAPASITLSANASAASGKSIAQVAFYNGSSLLGTDNSSPYSYSWTNVAAGTYTITAKATDNQGIASTSQAITITVNPSSGGSCASVPQYVENGGYVAGSRVKNVGNQYECKPYPYTGWCNGAAWAYAPGTGTYWTDAWILVGPCSTARDGAPEALNITDDESITIHPNPGKSGNSLTFTFKNHPGDLNIDLTNSSGTLLQSTFHKGVKNNLLLNVPSLSPGLYIFKIRGLKEQWMKKYLIKE